MFANAPKGSKFYNSSSTDIEREIEKLKDRIACCTENTPIIDSSATGNINITDWANYYVRLSGGGVNTIQIPEDDTYNFPIGTEITFFWNNAAATSFRIRGVAISVTINFHSPTALATCFIAANHSAVTIKKVAGYEWDAIGNIL
ncbi:MAG: hypothetical protein ABGY11_10820 [Candidatus Thioglobus sp.]